MRDARPLEDKRKVTAPRSSASAGLGALEPLGKITEAAVDLVFGVNVKGTIFTVQKGLPLMRDGGSIILT
ncbi:MAG: short chain dehydrogenase family protein [Rhodospirillales bacterium]|nr:short chain dehydrogenase family protein [Rhodospirillales bacterium]